MDLILALTDIHILIDIEPTTFTVHEIEKSLHGRKQIRTTLVRNFGERIANYHKSMGVHEISAAIQKSIEAPTDKLAEAIEENANFDPSRLSEITIETALSQNFDFTGERTASDERALELGHVGRSRLN